MPSLAALMVTARMICSFSWVDGYGSREKCSYWDPCEDWRTTCLLVIKADNSGGAWAFATLMESFPSFLAIADLISSRVVS